jgi:hypothetical protein
MKKEDFVEGCKHFGFRGKCKTIFVWLDWEDKKYITENDVVFMDDWKPPDWLMSMPNPDAASEMKNLLLRRYKHHLKAWRIALDRDNSNRCSWHEFQEGCKRVNFLGDVAGAWLYFDEDLSGYITLAELDEEACEVLTQFKSWADKEFGGVRSAFQVLDADGSAELSYREFRRATRDFGFIGETRILFQCLDVDATGSLTLDEVSFLDEWEDEFAEEADEVEVEEKTARKHQHGEDLLGYLTSTPGPGAYDVTSGLGALPGAPGSKHLGSASISGGTFRAALSCPLGRPGTWPGIANERPRSQKTARSSLISRLDKDANTLAPVGPGTYNPQIPGTFREIDQRRPWGFGRAKRQLSKTDSEGEKATPGPGSYEHKLTPRSPQFSIVPRRFKSGNPLKGERKTYQEAYTPLMAL